MGQDRRVAIHVITSTFRVIITTDTPEGDRRGISFHPKRVLGANWEKMCKLDHFVVSIKSD